MVNDPHGREPVPVQGRPFNAETPMADLADALTPTSSFYVRNHYDMPTLDAAAYRLEIAGCVDRPLTLRLDELKETPAKRQVVTLECAGNGRSALTPAPAGVPWRFGAAGTAEFVGVSLSDVLKLANVKATAVEVVLTGGDQGSPTSDGGGVYARSLSVDHALNQDVLLAWEMNGERLSVAHGFPLRAVVPGWYAMSSVKWLTRIDVIDHPFIGHWQANQYLYIQQAGIPDRTPVSRIRVRSVIASPSAGDRVAPGPVPIAGGAWSGEGEIVRVEVSTDGGERWSDAQILPSAGRGSAVPWRFEWTPSATGECELVARATDSAGHVQPLTPRSNLLGYGNNGVHRVCVLIAN